MKLDPTTQRIMPEHQVTHFTLCRHGKVELGGHRRVYGKLELSLSSEGALQASALVDYVAQQPTYDGIIASDLLRCRQMVAPIADALSLPVHWIPELQEQDMGKWEGKTWAELSLQDEDGVHAYWSDYVTAQPTGGESFGEMAHRVLSWLNEAQDFLLGKRWLLIAHAGTIRILLSHWMNTPLKQALRWAPAPGSVTSVDLAASGAVLNGFGIIPSRQKNQVSLNHRKGRAIAVTGSAGIGKSTLVREIASKYGLPKIHEGMRQRIESGLKLHELDHDSLATLIWDLWHEHRDAEMAALEESGGFVSDRCALDFFAFWLYYGFSYRTEETEALYVEVCAHLIHYDHILVLPWGVLPLESDGVRSANTWTQLRYQALLEGLLNREVKSKLRCMPDLVSLDSRLLWVEGLF